MFRSILPEHMESELEKRPEIDTLQNTIGYAPSLALRNSEKRLASAHAQRQRLALARAGGTRPNPLQSLQATNHEDLVNKLMAAIGQGGGGDGRGARRPDTNPRWQGKGGSKGGGGGGKGGGSGARTPTGGRRMPNPAFKGCWHCGKEGHSRSQCREFLDLRGTSGKPPNYKGAYGLSIMAGSVKKAPEAPEAAATAPIPAMSFAPLGNRGNPGSALGPAKGWQPRPVRA